MTRTLTRRLWLSLILLTPALAGAQPEADKVNFKTQIWPVIEQSCVRCHGPEKQKGKLRLDSRAAAFKGEQADWVIQPGSAEKSELYQRIILPADDLDVMPNDGKVLAKENIELIRKWIDQGADWPELERAVQAPLYEKITLRELTDAEKAAEEKAIAALHKRGALASAVALDTHARDVAFHLLGDKITDADLALLTGLEPSLVWLNLSGTAITDAGLERLAGFPELRRLHLARTGVGDAGVAKLEGLKHLEYLNLYGTQVTDHGLDHLAALPRLRKLYLWKAPVTDEGVARLEAALPGLKVVRGVRVLAAQPVSTPELPECCAKAAEKGEKCTHPCCVDAAARGKLCEKCGKPAAATAVAIPADCCKSAQEKGKECDHPCCVEARKNGTVCEKCGGKPAPKIDKPATVVAAGTPAPCCKKAGAAGKECDHPCCVEARKNGTVCEKCGGKPAAKIEKPAAVGSAGTAAPCCKKAGAAGKECDHPCCVEARKNGTVCEKCGGKPAAGVEKPATVGSAGIPAPCCKSAHDKGKECDHGCCVEARKSGTVCEKCGGKPAAKAAETVALPPCCQAAKDEGARCAHPCCVAAQSAGKICEKCAK